MPSPIAALLLLGIANFAPIIATRLFGSWFAQPLDCGIVLPDRQRLFGASKTLRGIVTSVVVTGLAGPALDLSVWSAGAVAAVSMAGDLASSFTKRRLG
ncbi:MAG: CDP-archaeol synthase, partial [Acetobacteraceae bacterium]|nr:CDP-archaeol synthase [Acetobacteraceae bacterium]